MLQEKVSENSIDEDREEIFTSAHNKHSLLFLRYLDSWCLLHNDVQHRRLIRYR